VLTAANRKAIHEAIDRATRAGLGPIARPGHPSRFQSITVVANRGHEVRHPSLEVYDSMPPSKPRILQALNG
jgi:hypothetical protein